VNKEQLENKRNVTYMVFMLLSTPKVGLPFASNGANLLWEAKKWPCDFTCWQISLP